MLERRRLEIVSPLLIRFPWALPADWLCNVEAAILLFWVPESLVEVAPAVPVVILVFVVAPLTVFPDGNLVEEPP